jgi:hypothetical protein
MLHLEEKRSVCGAIFRCATGKENAVRIAISSPEETGPEALVREVLRERRYNPKITSALNLMSGMGAIDPNQPIISDF